MTNMLTLAEVAEELCDPRQFTEPLWRWSPGRHRVRVGTHIVVLPGLLDQLHEAVQPLLSGLNDSGSRGVPKSTPPLQLDALDRWIDIEIHAGTWMAALGLTVRATPQDNIRGLVGAVRGEHAQQLLTDLRRWRGWAATMTGWQTLYTPRADCPVTGCGERGTLRINLDRKTAVCVACRSTWSEDVIGLLAEHIRQHEPAERVPVRSGAQGHGGWTTRRR